MSRLGCYSGRALKRSEIPTWIRVDSDGAIWTSHGQAGVTLTAERRAEQENGHGYLTVLVNGQVHAAHRVVYVWFHGEAPAGVLVRHLDDNRRNNQPCNLALGDQSENVRDAIRNGGYKGDYARGERNHGAKLTEATVKEIRVAHADGERQISLVKRFGVHKATISKIVRRDTWAHV